MTFQDMPQSEPSGAATSPLSRPAGLLEKLVAAVRPEFRVDVLVVDPADPVFGGAPCRVTECRRAAYLHDLCQGHYQRWHEQGRPDLGQFAAATSARMRGNAPVDPCRAPGCGYGRNSSGLCVAHIKAWRQSGQPDLGHWLDSLPPKQISAPHGWCRVPSCALWATARTPLCTSHAARWRKARRPGIHVFIDAYDETSVVTEHIDLFMLAPQLRLEMQYVLQRRRDEQQARLRPKSIQHTCHVLVRTGMQSLLEWPEETWRERIVTGPGIGKVARPLLNYARRQLEELCYGSGWEIEYPREVWRLRNLGFQGSHATFRFDQIDQPWLKEPAKRWARWRLSSGLSLAHVATGISAISWFSQFLARPDIAVEQIDQITRGVLEAYLADLRTYLDGGEHHRRLIGLLRVFFTDIRRHRWDTRLPSEAVFFPEDSPKEPKRLPRALAEHVMAQVENPANLDRWANPAYRLITVILIRCGLRLTDAVRLPFDCIVHDGDGAPYLRYFNHKMKREALVPIDEELERDLGDQQRRVQDRWPDGTAVLFPRATTNLTGAKPLHGSTYRWALDRWLEHCDIRDEYGRPVHLTPHQWRHTLGTRLINRDVPQEVVRKILDHDSHEMTAHYARLHDTTVRRHWEQARKVNHVGETVTLALSARLL